MTVSTLTPAQTEAVTLPPGPLLVVAGAGSGKTTTVTERILHQVRTGSIDPAATLAVTHSRRAAGELRARLIHAGGGTLSKVQVRTFHSAALMFVAENWALTGRDGTGPVLVDDKVKMVRAAAALAGTRLPPDTVRDVTGEITWAQTRRISSDRYVIEAVRAGRDPGVPVEQVADLYVAYEQMKTDRQVLDFEDLLDVAAQVAVEHPDRCRFTTFVVDEYQDTDPLQQHLLVSLVGDRTNDVCVVGDPRQCIYSFKGAEPRFLLEFTSWWPHARVVDLSENFRSTPQVLVWANRLDNGVLAGGFRTGALTTSNPDGPEPEVVSCPDEHAETIHVISTLKRWHRSGIDWDDMAVLFRFNAQSARFEAACAAEGVPVEVEDDGFFAEPAVLDVLRPFGQAARKDRRQPGLGLLVQTARARGWDPDRPPDGQGAARERHELVTALVELAGMITMTGLDTAGELLDELLERARTSHGTRAGGVSLMTLHRSKGLEFDAVIITGCVEGAIPAQQAVNTDQVVEERRLLYVGVTRARRLLQVTWGAKRPSPRGDGTLWQTRPSRWLTVLDPTADPSSGTRTTRRVRSDRDRLTASAAQTRVPGSGLAGCEGCGGRLVGVHQRRLRRCPECLTAQDRKLRDLVCGWRDRVAVERGVPAGTVLTDAAVIGIVASRPSTPGELLQIAGTSGVGQDAGTLVELITAT